ncbi:hypothetical protein P7K49_011199 [Saguinus oedipus]|uniref:Uncharacterized protein n=1 Tax=Saguinus oedipus TaxID=9490 RepID=A0ABQ9VPY8_SAGOE|nr:hypothetical protein P7K49_011199 [Saguinus oedipus]
MMINKNRERSPFSLSDLFALLQHRNYFPNSFALFLLVSTEASRNYCHCQPLDLRKQARQLENELDLKLVSFSKLCTSYSHSSARDGRRDRYRYYQILSFMP